MLNGSFILCHDPTSLLISQCVCWALCDGWDQWESLMSLSNFGVLNSIVYIYLLVMCQQATDEICGEPSTECSTGQPQRSTRGQRLREHSPRFPYWHENRRSKWGKLDLWQWMKNLFKISPSVCRRRLGLNPKPINWKSTTGLTLPSPIKCVSDNPFNYHWHERRTWQEIFGLENTIFLAWAEFACSQRLEDNLLVSLITKTLIWSVLACIFETYTASNFKISEHMLFLFEYFFQSDIASQIVLLLSLLCFSSINLSFEVLYRLALFLTSKVQSRHVWLNYIPCSSNKQVLVFLTLCHLSLSLHSFAPRSMAALKH